MTVKCIKPVDKAYIVDAFVAKTQTITQLAELYGRSRRTIVRVLEDHGIDPGIRRRRQQQFSAEQIKVPDLFGTRTGRVTMIEPLPWYRRALSAIASALSPSRT